MGKNSQIPSVTWEFDPEGEELAALLRACFLDYITGKLRDLTGD